MNLKKFSYIYGFLILIILVGGIFVARIAGIWDSMDVASKSEVEVAQGLKTPTGKFTLGEIIKGYDLNKEEFYSAIKLSLDYPEDTKVIDMVRNGEISYADVSSYMEPIIEAFGKQKRH